MSQRSAISLPAVATGTPCATTGQLVLWRHARTRISQTSSSRGGSSSSSSSSCNTNVQCVSFSPDSCSMCCVTASWTIQSQPTFRPLNGAVLVQQDQSRALPALRMNAIAQRFSTLAPHGAIVSHKRQEVMFRILKCNASVAAPADLVRHCFARRCRKGGTSRPTERIVLGPRGGVLRESMCRQKRLPAPLTRLLFHLPPTFLDQAV